MTICYTFKKEVIFCKCDLIYTPNHRLSYNFTESRETKEMTDHEFIKSFSFNILNHGRYHHTDNSKGVLYHYIGCLISGNAVLATKSERIEVEPGELFYIPNGCKYHSYWFASDSEVKFYSFAFSYFPKSQSKSYVLQKLSADADTEAIFSRLTENISVSASSVGLLYTLLGKTEPSMIYVSSDPRSEVLDRATALLTEDPEISINELSRLCSVSESTLYGLFKRHLGRTPSYMRNRIRCEKARTLLETTDTPIEDISRILGFSSSSYFRKIFFEHTRSTPRDVRKNARHI